MSQKNVSIECCDPTTVWSMFPIDGQDFENCLLVSIDFTSPNDTRIISPRRAMGGCCAAACAAAAADDDCIAKQVVL